MNEILIRWALWTLISALVLGGQPWRFPAGGRYLVESWFQPQTARNPWGR